MFKVHEEIFKKQALAGIENFWLIDYIVCIIKQDENRFLLSTSVVDLEGVREVRLWEQIISIKDRAGLYKGD